MSSSFIAAFLLMIVGPADAQIYDQKSDYLDWDYAVSLWASYDRGEAVAEWDLVMPAYEANKALVSGSREEVLERLAKHPKGDLIKRGHDLHRVYEVWKHVYRAVTYKDKGFAWNEWKSGGSCWVMEQRNVFTHSCRDLPDWRTKNDVKRDNAIFAETQQ
ncbi:hypothetical protein TH3_00930 [Thalassospira xiamenensis M-5 = DSM 17429]|uniref:DUF4440 domain-containing protein n=1 Tax=Thalassospira xiamenensis M-5 = DSM 17429 TaxID=1123366 RepID=A0AB72U802_9PROT|nr:hypothetical protein [Thalassospira xiamenensis]AJD50312.1 hypothetical protein TH3_00930 [Thalassospira xiamenensis M-5 = DSM 17429]